MLEKYNEAALDYYLRGKGGESMRREAEQELYRRGQQSSRMSDKEMIEHLTSLGYIVIDPSGEEMYMPDEESG